MKISATIPAIRNVKPYLLIAITALLGYLPVSSMLFSLKNDVVAIEYPFLHFISESVRNGDPPLWFNTWCLGFPVQSVLTWGIFSTPAVLTGTLLPFDFFVLHALFVGFVITSGWAMFKLLTSHFLPSKDLALLLSCCYMLSGFTAGSSQWLLYITGMTFIPLLLHCALNLLKKPSLKNAFLSALSFFLLLTNTHIYLTIFASYFLVAWFLIFLAKRFTDANVPAEQKKKLAAYISLAVLFAFNLCAAPVYFTIETVAYLERSNPLQENSAFFRSNYLHPEGLKSLLFPLSTVRSFYINTEGSILITYMGLLPLVLLPASLIINTRKGNKKAWGLLLLSLFFLVLSFGHLAPLREWLNILPGLSYFRHPGVLRVFFIMAFIVYLGVSFRDHTLGDILKRGTAASSATRVSLAVISLLSLAVIIAHAPHFPGIWKGSSYETIKNIGHEQLVLINAFIQFIFSSLLLFAAARAKKIFSAIIITELILNFLCCVPFYAVSSYPVKTVNRVLEARSGFPVQQTEPYNVPADIKNNGITIWRNTNTFRKEVSVNISMPGPLILEHVARFLGTAEKDKISTKQLVFIKDPVDSTDHLIISLQQPDRVKMKIKMIRSGEIVLQQAFFPGWKAYYNGRELPLSKNEFPFLSVIAPGGEGELVFKFEKKAVVYTAALLHIIVIASLFFLLVSKLFTRSSSPSLPN